ncbi:MAG: transglycosylase domain-containing protein [Anaerolineae bacterium]|nr:transglycosylase domain-containing protein [Anaerolineae bacterium]
MLYWPVRFQEEGRTLTAAIRLLHRRRRRRARHSERQLRLGLGLGVLLLFLALLVLLPAAGAWWMYSEALTALPPLPASGQAVTHEGPSHLYDRNGQTVLLSAGGLAGSVRSWRTLEELPESLIAATLLSEDPAFLDRPATSPVTLGVQLWQDTLGETIRNETLAVRLARTLYSAPVAPPGALTSDRELVIAAELERLHSREDLLEWHLNTNHYGNDAWGIEAAARLYLGKPATQLALDEVALLAAIPPEPELNPLQALAAARRRQDELLYDLLRAGHIDAREATAALGRETPVLARRDMSSRTAPEFSDLALQQARVILDSLGMDGERMLAQGGLRILTTLDLALQERASCLLQMHLGRLAPTVATSECQNGDLLPLATGMEAPPTEAALVILDLRNGELLAMLGKAADRRHPPGPLLQPYVYFEAFRTGRTAADMLLDVPLEIPGDIEGLLYAPTNNDGLFRGPLPLRDAMSAGLLPPSIQLASELRLDNVLARASSLGLTGLDAVTGANLSLLERGGAVSLLDAANSYALFATQGEQRGLLPGQSAGPQGPAPLSVLAIEDSGGRVLWQAQRSADLACSEAPDCTSRFAAELGFLVNDVLADQAARVRVLGEADVRLLDVGRPAAVVSGMSGQRQVAWTLGYSPGHLVGVQMGRGEDGPMSADAPVGGPAAHFWHAMMLLLHEGQSAEVWPPPDNIIELEVCERSGLLPNGICPTRREHFIAGLEPQQMDNHWQLFAINSANNRLATVNTAPELLGQRAWFVPPPEALAWWLANDQPLPPDLLDEPGQVVASLSRPLPFAWVGGLVEIHGNIDPQGLNYYLLEQGEGLNPQRWQSIGAGRNAPFASGLLGTWDTEGLSGLHSLRLTVVRSDGSREAEQRQVTVDNQAPSLELEPGNLELLWPALREIHLNAGVQDNLAVERVEFYRNGHLLGIDRVWPWGFDWKIEGVGMDVFRAVAYDEVGNQASDEMVLRVVPGRAQDASALEG